MDAARPPAVNPEQGGSGHEVVQVLVGLIPVVSLIAVLAEEM